MNPPPASTKGQLPDRGGRTAAVIDDPVADCGTAMLVPMTPEARAAVGNKAYVRMSTFPFRIGREARNPLARAVTRVERRLGTTVQLNDLYLIDASTDGDQISRTHCVIDRIEGEFRLKDRGSTRGSTVVESRADERPAAIATKHVGNYGDFQTPLRDGDVIVMGNLDSPYVFRFEVEPLR
jgi:FHA domain-containing protein